MADFSHLKALDVSKDKTVEYTLHAITVNGLTPTLILAPATEANGPYFNAVLKRAGKLSRLSRSGVVSASMLDENRDEDRELFPLHVAKGWRDVVDAKAKPVEFSADECEQFLGALPDWLFDEMRLFAGNPSNFADMIDVQVASKNSPGGSSGS